MSTMPGRRRPFIASVAATAIGAALVISSVFVASSPAVGARAAHDTVRTSAAIEFRNNMRRLWEEHVTWTRLVIVSFAAGLPDLDPTIHRLLQNQVDIGNAVKPFYGDAAGDQLTHLLKRHIRLAAKILAAAKSGDMDAFRNAKRAWYANARRIARFLHAANPQHWPLADLRTMMRRHLDLTLAEASDYLNGRYKASISDFDRVEAEILRMADMLSIGIIRQFPNRFAS
jgi:hypothetical protein